MAPATVSILVHVTTNLVMFYRGFLFERLTVGSPRATTSRVPKCRDETSCEPEGGREPVLNFSDEKFRRIREGREATQTRNRSSQNDAVHNGCDNRQRLRGGKENQTKNSPTTSKWALPVKRYTFQTTIVYGIEPFSFSTVTA